MSVGIEAMEAGLAIGDRLKVLRGVLDFIKSLGIDQAELLKLAKLAVELFKGGFSLDGVFAFLEELLKAIESKAAAQDVGTLAIDWESMLRFVTLLFELFSRFGK